MPTLRKGYTSNPSSKCVSIRVSQRIICEEPEHSKHYRCFDDINPDVANVILTLAKPEATPDEDYAACGLTHD